MNIKMENITNFSHLSYTWEFEYYYDYIDPVVVDEHKLKYNKYSVVIIFWMFLAAFVSFFFGILILMSHPKNTQR
ncbi:melanocortin-2 receptor accessory protein-like [Hypomesus transpacificus]|uniref:melanocortin-2 receptor accessory protein-like n=1 Tax=Hypomesus transpacificus TaxID=137520 RepID=UPI001F0776CD|nr:melanocortin-2 receptor accessory protein-like [Hypomesus transpacificus]